MGKPSRRPRREARKQNWKERKEARKELRRRLAEQGLKSPERPTLPNRKSELRTEEEEQAERQKVVEEQLKVYRIILPELLKRLEKIKDPRDPKTVKHKLTVVLLYGILTFVFHMTSRREANRKMSMPVFLANLQAMFPELETLPHNDTLNRLLSNIEVEQIEATQVELVQKFIRNKKFYRYLVEHCYPIAIDGTQKFQRDYCWSEECMERRPQGEEENTQYYVYVLEANLVFSNGVNIPLLSEFLEYTKDELVTDKQDCELKAFKRLAGRLKEYFPRLPIMVLLDGLYPNGPVIELCRKNNWQFMIVLQDKSLPAVWEEAEGLRKLQPGQTLDQTWGDRRQHFWWVNGIEYYYGVNERKKQTVHLVVCEESWEEIDPKTGEIVTKTSRHAWLSSEPLSKKNVHARCNLAARHRWGIENNILVEKHHGYQYEHCFSYNWNAMKGYHYLMRLAHLMNNLAHKTIYLAEKVCTMGVRGLAQFVRETCTGPWLDKARLRQLLTQNHQLRLE